jgi:hypothetical protein
MFKNCNIISSITLRPEESDEIMLSFIIYTRAALSHDTLLLSGFSIYVLLCRKLEKLEFRKQELEAVGNKETPAMKQDAQNQAGTSMSDGNIVSQDVLDEQTLAVKLEEAEKIIRRLRRENEENRREVSVTECKFCFPKCYFAYCYIYQGAPVILSFVF